MMSGQGRVQTDQTNDRPHVGVAAVYPLDYPCHRTPSLLWWHGCLAERELEAVSAGMKVT